ncbi:MAG: radical SAM protein [Nitrospirota bacterium]
MRILLVLPPTAERPTYPEPPAGLLYVASALQRAGHEPTVLDAYRNTISPAQLVATVREGSYDIVGFGGITTCYAYVKLASRLIRETLPSVHLIAGGVLSSALDLLLTHTPIDVVCLREGEVTAVNIVNRLAEGKRDFDDIKGVAFTRNGETVKTPAQPMIANLDEIPFPNYDLIDMEIYALDAMRDPIFSVEPSSRTFYRPGMRVFNLKTARGCTNACTFCYRHLLGYRQHSLDYVIGHIKHLRDRYNIHFLRFGDELFTRNKQWVIDLARRLRDERIDIRYVVHGVRTDNVDRELMDAIKASGGVTAFIGFESGSQTILDVMRKNVTVEQNISAIRTIRESGLDVLAQTVIAMPGETTRTIDETIDSLVRSEIDVEWVSINYAQAYPGTWLWDYAVSHNMITDKERYLLGLGSSNSLLLNYTTVPQMETARWEWRIRKALLLARYRRHGRIIDRIKSWDPRLYSFLVAVQREGFVSAVKSGFQYVLSKYHG